jgi:hypothetical protein
MKSLHHSVASSDETFVTVQCIVSSVSVIQAMALTLNAELLSFSTARRVHVHIRLYYLQQIRCSYMCIPWRGVQHA